MRWLSVAVITALLLTGCNRTFIFGPDQMPKISEGQLHLREVERSHAPVDSFEINRVGLRHLSAPNLLTAPDEAEYAALLEGRPLAVHSIEIDVDASHVHWRDYGLGGAGVGITLAVLSNLNKDRDGLFTNNQSAMVLVTVMTGVVGFLAGLIGGTLASPDVIDMRYVEGAREN